MKDVSLVFYFMGMWSHLCSIPYIECTNSRRIGQQLQTGCCLCFAVPRDQVGACSRKWATAPPVVNQRTEWRFVSEKWCRGNLACWLTRQCEGPWWMRMRTMSTSPRQAARCSGKHPLLSSTFVDASYCSSFSTTCLQRTHTLMYCYFPDQTRKILLKHITSLYGSVEMWKSCVATLDERLVCLPNPRVMDSSKFSWKCRQIERWRPSSNSLLPLHKLKKWQIIQRGFVLGINLTAAQQGWERDLSTCGNLQLKLCRLSLSEEIKVKSLICIRKCQREKLRSEKGKTSQEERWM